MDFVNADTIRDDLKGHVTLVNTLIGIAKDAWTDFHKGITIEPYYWREFGGQHTKLN